MNILRKDWMLTRSQRVFVGYCSQGHNWPLCFESYFIFLHLQRLKAGRFQHQGISDDRMPNLSILNLRGFTSTSYGRCEVSCPFDNRVLRYYRTVTACTVY
ncbi:hypothetical protein GUJ93_ZPchr0006g42557 [Zizania palustris]|uniref:Uncharacterized protein n=1 Tax=Zizania palustris TaxID=103762 RepID=A0A8J5S6P2_ZIZPA|nr:hypothetical protein GUJ93_ZPchr0006g42557 [Zizania palustris]